MNFRDGVEVPTFDVVEETTTYFLPRDEDGENTFHSQADFFNMYLVKDILAYDVSEQQVLIRATGSSRGSGGPFPVGGAPVAINRPAHL